MRRERNIVFSPYLLNHLSVQSRCVSLSRKYFPYRLRNGRPPYRPISYPIQLPIMLPMVAASVTSQMLSEPSETRYPANGSTASLGSGNIMLSSTMRIAIPGYPRKRMMLTTHSMAKSSMRSHEEAFEKPYVCEQKHHRRGNERDAGLDDDTMQPGRCRALLHAMRHTRRFISASCISALGQRVFAAPRCETRKPAVTTRSLIT